jgi:putative ATP-binding cassette transporter
MQTAQAFQQMVGALSWPIDNVSNVAGWRASVERVLGLSDALGRARERRSSESGRIVRIEPGQEPALVFDQVAIADRDGAPMTKPFSARFVSGQRIVIAGGSDTAFKFLKAAAGLWPWGSGRVILPGTGPLFFVPRRPYLPPGSLGAAVSYPAPPQQFGVASLYAALTRVGLAYLVSELDKSRHWDEVLSDEEQQRLGFARLLLFHPRWIVIQEAFDILTSEARKAMFELLAAEFSESAIVVIGQAPDLEAFATHRLDLDAGTFSALAAVPAARTG